MSEINESKELVKNFLADLAETQDKYGLYIVTELEEPILVSLEPNANNHNIVCYTNQTIIDEFDVNRGVWDQTNLEKYIDGQDD